MRVQAAPPQAPARPEAAPRATEARGDAARVVKTQETPLSPGEIKGALQAAYHKLHGKAAPKELLDILSAQVCTETASGAKMHDFNFGGIKGVGPSGLTAKVRTREIIDGREERITDGFRAYRTPVEGATDYLSFLERRFPKALERAAEGDVSGYVAKLKAGRYFTADETAYAAAVRTHRDVTVRGAEATAPTGHPTGAVDLATAGDLVLPSDPGAFATSHAVALVMDAMARSSASLAAPSDED